MNVKLKRQLRKRKQQTRQRIDPGNWSGQSPMIDPPLIKYELAQRQQAISAGGIGTILQVIKRVKLREAIQRRVSLLKVHLPYDEADHIFNIALNLLAGGTCLDHIEDRRTDEAYLNGLGAERIPDPTTAGDFCRRFGTFETLQLQQVFRARGKRDTFLIV